MSDEMIDENATLLPPEVGVSKVFVGKMFRIIQNL